MKVLSFLLVGTSQSIQMREVQGVVGMVVVRADLKSKSAKENLKTVPHDLQAEK